MAYFHTNVLDNQIKALPTVDTASGSVATFDTDLTENLIECVCDIDNSVSSIAVGYDKNYDYFVDFNQMAKPISNDNYDKNASTVSYSDGVATITATGNYARIYFKTENTPTITANNVYLVTCDYKTNFVHQINPINMKIGNVLKNRIVTPTPNNWSKHYEIIKATNNVFNYMYFGDISSRYVSGDITDVKNIQFIDITQILGSTIADEIYNLETQTTGSGLAYFKNIFPNDYYDYTLSTIETIGSANNDGTGKTFQISFGETVSSGATYEAVSGLLTRSDTTTKKVDNCIIPTNNDINHILCNMGDISVKYLLSVGKKIS